MQHWSFEYRWANLDNRIWYPKERASKHIYLRLQCHQEDSEDKAPIHEQMLYLVLQQYSFISIIFAGDPSMQRKIPWHNWECNKHTHISEWWCRTSQKEVIQRKKQPSAASMDKNFGAFLSVGSPYHTMVTTLLMVITSSGKREWFEKNINSIFLERKGNEVFIFLFNTSVSIFKMEFHNRNCANNSAQQKTDKLPVFLTNTHCLPFS